MLVLRDSNSHDLSASMLQARTHAAAKDWESLVAMAEKKSPVGLEPLIGICKEHDAPQTATARLVPIKSFNV